MQAVEIKGILLFFTIISLLLLFNCSREEEPDESIDTQLIGGSLQGEEIEIEGVVTSFVGPSNGIFISGDTEGQGNVARFYGPSGITTDGTNIYVADSLNDKIRQIVIDTRVVTTIAGPEEGSSAEGDTNASGSNVRFNDPNGITTDGTNLYVADTSNNKIRQIVISTGVTSTIAGPKQGSTTSGDTDNTGSGARFNGPYGITTDGTNLYVADTSNNKIRQIVISTGVVTTIAGPAAGSTSSGDINATGNDARFLSPYGITTDGTNLYVSDSSNNKIRQIVIESGEVTNFAGAGEGSTTSGDDNGIGNDSLFYFPVGITSDGTNLYVTDALNHKIRKIIIASKEVITLAGPEAGTVENGVFDGTGSSARFNLPWGITTDGIDLFLSDFNNNKIRKIE